MAAPMGRVDSMVDEAYRSDFAPAPGGMGAMGGDMSRSDAMMGGAGNTPFEAAPLPESPMEQSALPQLANEPAAPASMPAAPAPPSAESAAAMPAGGKEPPKTKIVLTTRIKNVLPGEI